MMPNKLVFILAVAVAGCGQSDSNANDMVQKAPYLSTCAERLGVEPSLLFDSRLSDGVQIATFYRLNDGNFTKLVSFVDTWRENVAGKIDGLPPEADHYMIERGANMDGEVILSGYELIFPMKRIDQGQQMVGEDILRLRTADGLFELTCSQLDPLSETYANILNELNS